MSFSLAIKIDVVWSKRILPIFLLNEILISGIKSPRELISQSLQEIIFIQSHQTDSERFTTDSELYVHIDNFFSGIQRTDKLFRPSFNLKRNNIIVRHYN